MTSVLKRGPKKGKSQENPTEKKWLHSPDALQQGSVVYSVKLFGSTEVAQAKGTEIVREAIKKVRFANHIKKSEVGVKGSKLKKVEIKISIDNIKVEDIKTKEELFCYPLHRISYCADDKRDKKVFAFIAKDSGMPLHLCYVFECEKMAEELTLTVGQAFDLAYRRFLEKKSNNQETTKKLSEMEERIKTAEEEKEALKQKIAKLELAAGQGTPTSNGNTEVSRGQSITDEFDLLGGFGGLSTTSGSPTQNSAPQDETSQEMSFDPFAQNPSPQPAQKRTPSESSAPLSPDFNEFSPQPLLFEAPVSRPTPKGPIPQALPPPPTKQSVKAANRSKQGGGVLPNVASPTQPTSPASPTSPVSLPSPSHELLQIGNSNAYNGGNPFSIGVNGTDPSEHVFDPLALKNSYLGSGKEINQNSIKAGF